MCYDVCFKAKGTDLRKAVPSAYRHDAETGDFGPVDHVQGVAVFPRYPVPYHVRPVGEDIFFLPGLYSVAKLPDKETGELVDRYTYAVVTRGGCLYFCRSLTRKRG